MKKRRTEKNRGVLDDRISRFPDEDRISELPDGVLSLILSFLDTKTAVKTAVLSRRWRRVWTSVPRLDFKFDHRYSSSLSFTSFVNSVLLRRYSSVLSSFRLSLRHAVDPTFIEKCLSYAADHGVEYLKIRPYSSRWPAHFPTSTFHRLRYLSLNNGTCASMALPKSIALPELKLLRLRNFVFSDQTVSGEVFSGCPGIETLTLSRCSLKVHDKLAILDISLKELKILEISSWRSPWFCYNEQSINVTAPKLESFKYKGHIARVFFMEELGCLDNVCIDLCYPRFCTANSGCRKLSTAEGLLSMMAKFCNIKFLSLSLTSIEALSAVPDFRAYGASTFGNLRYLKFTVDDKSSEITIPIHSVAKLVNLCQERKLLLGIFEQDTKISSASNIDLQPYEREPNSAAVVNLDFTEARLRSEDGSLVNLPLDVMSYLLDSSPQAESLIVELPKVSCERTWAWQNLHK